MRSKEIIRSLRIVKLFRKTCGGYINVVNLMSKGINGRDVHIRNFLMASLFHLELGSYNRAAVFAQSSYDMDFTFLPLFLYK